MFSNSINNKYLPWGIIMPLLRLKYGNILYDEVFATNSVSHIIDSSKDIEWYRFNSNRYRCKYLFIRRPVESYFAAVKRAHGWPVFNLIPKIKLQLKKINHFYNSLAVVKKYVVDYENLCFNTDNVMSDIYNFIDLEYDDSYLQFGDLDFHLIGGNSSHILQNHTDSIDSLEKIQNIAIPNSKKLFYNKRLGIFFDERWKQELSEKEKMLINREIPNAFVF